MTRILIVEDEERLARSLSLGLREELYVVDHARDGEEALWYTSSNHHDAILLDIRIPKIDGWEVCRRVRAEGSRVPIIMLTACDTTSDVVNGLDLGADDYLTKPFEFAVLLARLRALLRRGAGSRDGRLRLADLEIDTRERRVWRGDHEIALTNMEYRVLEHLMRNARCVERRAKISAAIWDDEIGPDSNVLEVLISNLRRKIDRDSSRPLLHTRRGAGYVLTDALPSRDAES